MCIVFAAAVVVAAACYLFVFWQLATWQVAPAAEIIRAAQE